MASENAVTGIHHVTAITSDAQANADFYCGVLGLRLVKRTVNFDDPGSYHLYYGDEEGRPGTAMTFFAWPGARRGRIGAPQVATTAFAAPAHALDYWRQRVRDAGFSVTEARPRFGEPVIAFEDPDGLQLEIVGVDAAHGAPWAGGPVPHEFGLRGFHGVTLVEDRPDDTAAMLCEVLGFLNDGADDNRYRFRASTGSGLARCVDVVAAAGERGGAMGTGVVHHVAYRVPGKAAQSAFHAIIVRNGFHVSPVMDRVYFQSIYFREPGGVLFEIATDTPGFTADEPAASLGQALMLPPWLESRRTEIAASLPPLHV